jgi:hypothetical protein
MLHDICTLRCTAGWQRVWVLLCMVGPSCCDRCVVLARFAPTDIGKGSCRLGFWCLGPFRDAYAPRDACHRSNWAAHGLALLADFLLLNMLLLITFRFTPLTTSSMEARVSSRLAQNLPSEGSRERQARLSRSAVRKASSLPRSFVTARSASKETSAPGQPSLSTPPVTVSVTASEVSSSAVLSGNCTKQSRGHAKETKRMPSRRASMVTFRDADETEPHNEPGALNNGACSIAATRLKHRESDVHRPEEGAIMPIDRASPAASSK